MCNECPRTELADLCNGSPRTERADACAMSVLEQVERWNCEGVGKTFAKYHVENIDFFNFKFMKAKSIMVKSSIKLKYKIYSK